MSEERPSAPPGPGPEPPVGAGRPEPADAPAAQVARGTSGVEPRAAIGPSGRVLGVDLGTRRVGVAVCDSQRRVATPIGAIERAADPGVHRGALIRLVAEHEAVGVVVGLPRSLSGGLGPAARAALVEVAELAEVLGVPVETADERLSTVVAAAALSASGRRAREQRRLVDASAAAVILQSWIDSRAGAQG